MSALAPHDFWQSFEQRAGDQADDAHSYVATMPDGRRLRLPIRILADGQHALASLIVNQASFIVLDALADHLAAEVEAFRPDIVIGLPTLGLTLAGAVARRLGHGRYVPLGFSRKFWYDDRLSIAVSSVTTPDQQKRLYVDPRMLPLVQKRRIALIDDVISSGTSLLAAIDLLSLCHVEPVVIGAAMLQLDRWRAALRQKHSNWPDLVKGVFSTPLLARTPSGHWKPVRDE